MIHASEFLDYDRLPKLAEDGLLSRREHPELPLFVYNYTARVQYERMWCPETLACRGLILDADGYVLARPFGKFFNLSEHDSPSLPGLPVGEPFEAFEKLDGSLGIAYRRPDTGAIQIATRGAFASDQALWACEWWTKNTADVDIPDGQTWLFEIIYPENRIVVNYGDRSELVLLSALDNATGMDLPVPSSWPGAVARRYTEATVDELAATVSDPQNFEGFVLRYPSTGQRVKVKLDEYVRLHRLLTQFSNKTIWELLSSGQGLGEVLERVPDEFYSWVRSRVDEMQTQYHDIHATCLALHARLAVPGDRKATALEFVKQEHPGILFNMYDGKDPSALIWKAIKPKYEKPFVQQFETAA